MRLPTFSKSTHLFLQFSPTSIPPLTFSATTLRVSMTTPSPYRQTKSVATSNKPYQQLSLVFAMMSFRPHCLPQNFKLGLSRETRPSHLSPLTLQFDTSLPAVLPMILFSVSSLAFERFDPCLFHTLANVDPQLITAVCTCCDAAMQTPAPLPKFTILFAIAPSAA